MHHPDGPATVVVAGVLVLTACAGDAGDGPTTGTTENTVAVEADDDGAGQTSGEVDSQQRHPDVVEAELSADGDLWRLSATLSSPYDSPEDIDEIVVQGRDLEHEWGGDTVSVPVPGR